MLAVTTFSPKGYEKYGRRMLEGMAKYFPGRIVAYYEEKPDWADKRVELRDWHAIPGANEYLDRLKLVFGSDGHNHREYDFRYDCNKFCRKVFAQEAVFDEDEYVFWVDSDTIVFNPVPESSLIGMFKGRALFYLGRDSYTETGFIGFHTKHPDFKKFRDNYLPYFTSGRIFSQMRGWHDCIAFDHARQGVSGHNLTPNGKSYDAVLSTTDLAKYFDHLKGNRKDRPEVKPKMSWA